MSQVLTRPSAPVLFIPQKQPAKPRHRPFRVVSEYEPAGDQPTAIRELVRGVEAASATRCCSASPARARPSPWPR